MKNEFISLEGFKIVVVEAPKVESGTAIILLNKKDFKQYQEEFNKIPKPPPDTILNSWTGKRTIAK